MLEKELEAKLVKGVQGLGGYCLKWVSPGNRGVPDRIVLLPGGRVVFVEMKRPAAGSKPSPLQDWWKDRLEDLGFECWTVYNEDDLSRLMKYLKYLKGVIE